MNFGPTQEQVALCDQMKSFSNNTLGKDLSARDAAGEFRREDWEACAKEGVFGLNTPKELGGSGHDILTSAVSYTHLTLPTNREV